MRATVASRRRSTYVWGGGEDQVGEGDLVAGKGDKTGEDVANL